MRFLLLILLLAGFSARADDTPLAPLLTCPHCGSWDLVWGSRGTAGETVVIAPERVTIPALGEYCVHAVKQTVAPGQYGERHYLATIDLALACGASDSGHMRLTIDVTQGAYRDGSHADITITDATTTKEVFKASGWNDARESPCETGSGNSSYQCGARAHALSYKRLAYVAYVVQAAMPKRAAYRFAKTFKPASFALAVAAFCDKREAQRGVGGWPAVYSMICQDARIGSKVAELEAWEACNSAHRPHCKVPGSHFDTSQEPRPN